MTQYSNVSITVVVPIEKAEWALQKLKMAASYLAPAQVLTSSIVPLPDPSATGKRVTFPIDGPSAWETGEGPTKRIDVSDLTLDVPRREMPRQLKMMLAQGRELGGEQTRKD